MASRETLLHISNIITRNKDIKVSEMAELQNIIDKQNIYLIICGDYYSLHTAAELGFTQTPAGYFTKPNRGKLLHVLVRERRNPDTLIAKGWL